MDQHNQANSDIANDGRKKYIIGWGVIVALLCCCIYLFISKHQIVMENNIALKQKQQIIDSVKTDRTYLQADFDAASVKIDQLMSKNASLKDSLQDSTTAIADLRIEIRTILCNQKATQVELLKARNMINILNDKTQTYGLYIAQLERDNKTLTGENEILAKERDETVETNIALKMAGAVLHASNIRVKAIHKYPNGMSKETSNALNVDKIRIFFDIDENRIAESGIKEIYVRIIAPGNKVLYSDNVSGTMNTVKEKEIKFSMLAEINLVKNEPLKNAVIEWRQGDTYPKGEYKIELYNGGYKIGKGAMELR